VIPIEHVTHWRSNGAPWLLDEQVEQDLIISRALIELFQQPELVVSLAFRGGTALHKLYLAPAVRYSEDIDLVQIVPGSIGPVLDAIHACLDPWLGPASYKQKENMCTLRYRFMTEAEPRVRARLKIEIQTREAFTTHGVVDVPFAVDSPWFCSSVMLRTFSLEELLGTKLRALYQRRKGRDAFDLAHALDRQPQLDCRAVVDCFVRYMERSGHVPSRADFERNLADKRTNAGFMTDMRALLHPEYGPYEPGDALDRVVERYIALLV
jgi:predicted nucleotidyltransferase component of viral defense system